MRRHTYGGFSIPFSLKINSYSYNRTMCGPGILLSLTVHVYRTAIIIVISEYTATFH